MKEIRTHETLSRRMDGRQGSDRAFGVVFAVVFAVIGVWPLLRGGDVALWALGLGAAFLAVALARPRILAPFNRLWFRFGLLLHAVVGPVVLGLIYAVSVVPTGLIMRARGYDPLRRKKPVGDTYWIAREPGPAPDSFDRQF